MCRFETSFGPMLVILVGALIVASIETVWPGPLSPYQSIQANEHSLAFDRGAEIGRFLLRFYRYLLFSKRCDGIEEDTKSGQSECVWAKLWGTYSKATESYGRTVWTGGKAVRFHGRCNTSSRRSAFCANISKRSTPRATPAQLGKPRRSAVRNGSSGSTSVRPSALRRARSAANRRSCSVGSKVPNNR